MAGATITLKNLPKTLHRSLKASAKKNKRSLNQEAIRFLEAGLMQDQRKSPSLLDTPPTRSVGKVLVPRSALISRADDMLDRGE